MKLLAIILLSMLVVVGGLLVLDAVHEPSCVTQVRVGAEVVIPGERMRVVEAPGAGSSDLVLDVVREPFSIPDYTLDPDHGHIHPYQSEGFEIVSGRAALLVGERYLELGPGETAMVPANTLHHWMALDGEPVRAIATFSPGLSMGDWFVNFHHVINEGKMNLLHAAVIAREYSDSSPLPVDPGPRIWNFLARVLAPVGRMSGYSACPLGTT